LEPVPTTAKKRLLTAWILEKYITLSNELAQRTLNLGTYISETE
jgi:hypothetical protein